MKTTQSGFTLFNLDTMSGVFPGARTRVFQRLRLVSIAAFTHQSHTNKAAQWAQLLWYETPGVCRLFLLENAGDNGRRASPLFEVTVESLEDTEEVGGHFLHTLRAALDASGWRAEMCGNCRFWAQTDEVTADGLPLGECRWRDADEPVEPGVLALQSALALGCEKWQSDQTTPSALRDERAETILASRRIEPLTREAEVSARPTNLWERLQGRFRPRPRPASQRPSTQTFAQTILERSGVGAGTESCFACQGRIANLGALAVETAEGDKQTLSVWRCRICFTFYLNSWVDRWERLDSLETEESYFRVAPTEALMLLSVIDAIEGAEHPGQRRERTAQRDWFNHFLAHRQPLSHQIKQGR